MLEELIENLTLAESSRVYLDHASITPPRMVVRNNLKDFLDGSFASDPSRIYTSAIATRDLIEYCRSLVSQFFGTTTRQIVFTSSASEAINHAVFDSMLRLKQQSAILVSKTEHSAVKRACLNYGKVFNHEVTEISVDAYGAVDLNFFKDLLERFKTRNIPVGLVAVQYSNHEIGTIQPIKEVSDLCNLYGVPLLIDLACTISNTPLDLTEVNYTYLALNGYKLGAMVGSGALIVKKNHVLKPLIYGANQELARRSGMENLLSISSLATVLDELSDQDFLEDELNRKSTYISKTVEAIKEIDGIEFYGSPVNRLENLTSFSISGIQASALTLQLDQFGVAVHSGSACSNEVVEPSYILEAIGKPDISPIRVSVGWNTTQKDIEIFLKQLNRSIEVLKKYGAK
jgi:cysteine desulfurase